ncbi:MAG TPA: TrbG/VirB9 family P-type conjugative transfer protein [Bryobacteraceae bacterium]|jgi:type IV secretion system protein VirB9
MKPTRLLSSFAIASLCAVLLHGQSSATKHPAEPARPAGATPPVPTAESDPIVRVVHYGERDVVKLKAKLRYTTLIVLPKTEKILDFTCGDKDFWVVNGSENMAYIKPAKAGAQTNLNLITASGNIYSFVLVEVSEATDSAPDLKVYIEPKDDSMISAANAAPRFVSAQTLDDYRQQTEMAKEETRQVKQSAQTEIDSGINRFLSNVRFPYRFEAGKKPFYVRAMYNDEKFTYIQARPEETPVLYEIADGKPNLVNFEYANGVFVIRKILDRGYLAIGKEKLNFTREE